MMTKRDLDRLRVLTDLLRHPALSVESRTRVRELRLRILNRYVKQQHHHQQHQGGKP